MLSVVGKLLKDFILRLSHEVDGLIFQGWGDAYVRRTHDGLLKWKYDHMNSVDFLFEGLGFDSYKETSKPRNITNGCFVETSHKPNRVCQK